MSLMSDLGTRIGTQLKTLQTAIDGKLSTSGKAADSNLLDGLDSSVFVRSNADDTVSGNLNTTAALSYTQAIGPGAVRVIQPQGGMYATNTSTITGYLKITLPVSWTNTMLMFDIDLYDYAGDVDGESIRMRVGGYNYSTSSAWSNVFANVVSGRTDRFFNVRFGHDGTKCAIYIGEATSTWNYPQVSVSNFSGGYSGATNANWADGWVVEFTTTLGTITKTKTLENVASYAITSGTATTLATARTIALSGDVTGSVSFDGSANATITATVADDSHNHIIANIDNLQTTLDGKLATTGKAADSNLLDGLDSASFLRSDTDDTFTNLSGTSITLGAGVLLKEATDRPDLLLIQSSTTTWGGLQFQNSAGETLTSIMADGSNFGIYDDQQNEWTIYCAENAGVTLYYNGASKLATTSVGASVTGTMTATAFVGDGSGLTNLPTTSGTGDNYDITWSSKAGHNHAAFIINGDLYTAHGVSSYGAYNSGRGGDNFDPLMGLNNMGKVTNIPNTSGYKKVGHNGSSTYALMNDGSLYMWGYNGYGQCGLGHANQVYTPTLTATGVVDVFGQESHSYSVHDSRFFIVKSDGLYAAGYNGYGQLGIGNTTTVYTWTKCTGFTNTSSSNIIDVQLNGGSYGSTFLLTSDGKIWVCGYNGYGQLGFTASTSQNSFLDNTSAWTGGYTSGVTSMKLVGGSGYHDGNGYSQVWNMIYSITGGTKRLRGCGNNNWGQLGTGNTTQIATPKIPVGITESSISDIANLGGAVGTVNLLYTNGDLYAWGYNGYGQVGDGTTTSRTTPLKIQTGVTAIWSDRFDSHTWSYRHCSFIQKADGLYGCGYNGDYGLGLMDNTNRTTHTKIPLPEDDKTIKLFGSYTTTGSGIIYYAITSNNNLYAWGYNGHWGVYGGYYSWNVRTPLLIKLPIRD